MANNLHIPIFLASNNNYAPFIATVISSICYNTHYNIDFYVLDSNISSFNKKIIENLKTQFNNFAIEFIKIDFKKYFKDFKQNNEWSLDIYSRFLIPDLKKDIKKAIYIDVDTIILDDISKLYNINIEKYGLGAIPDLYDCIKHRKELSLNIKGYFNSGVLLINCNYWRKNNIFNKLLELEKQHRDKLKFFDQDLLNICFQNNYKKLDYKYNLQTNQIFNFNGLDKEEQSRLNEAINNPVIRHFSALEKPWLTNKIKINEKYTKIPNFEDFWYFLKMTGLYDIILPNFILENNGKNNKWNINERVKLFHLFPILKIRYIANKTKVYLFNFIPLLTIKEKND